MKRLAWCMVLMLSASIVAAKPISRARHVSDAERAATTIAARFLSEGPEAVWTALASDSPLRRLGRDVALREISARLGPVERVEWSLQTVMPSLQDHAAAFGVSFDSGVDDSILFEMKNERGRWAIIGIRTMAEPARMPARLAPRTRVVRKPVVEHLDRTIALAAVLPCALLVLVAVAVARTRRVLAILIGSVCGVAFLGAAALAVGLALPMRVVETHDPPALNFVPLQSLVAMRSAVAAGDAAAVARSLASLPPGPTRDVAQLWSLQLDMLQERYGRVRGTLDRLPRNARAPLVHLLRARASFFENRMADTVIAYEGAIGTGAGRDALWLEIAQVLAALGFDDRANAYLHQIGTIRSREPSVYYMLSMMSVLDGDEESAAAYLMDAWQMQPIQRENVLEMAILWQVIRRPFVAEVLRFDRAQEPRFAVQSTAPIELAANASAEVVGECMLVQTGSAKLRVPGGARFAPAGAVIVDATTWERREEAAALSDFVSIRDRARASSALADPEFRRRSVITASALAYNNRWQDLIALTDPLSARDERVPIELMILRGHALGRNGRNAELRTLLAGLLQNGAVKRRKDPGLLIGIAELLATIESWDAAIAMFGRVRNEIELPQLDHRIDQLMIERNLAKAYQIHRTKHFEIHYPPDTPKNQIEQIGVILERELARMRVEWLPVPNFRRTVVNILWWQDFKRYSGSEYIAGLFTDEIFLPVAGVQSFRPEIVAIMTHELFHAMLAEATNNFAPRWFHEAFATRVEMTPESRNAFQLFRDEYFLSVALLDAVANHSPDPERIGSAYLIGESTLRFIEARWGRAGLNAIVRAYAKGMNTEAAMREATGHSVAELDGLARAWGASQPTIFPGKRIVRYDGVPWQ